MGKPVLTVRISQDAIILLEALMKTQRLKRSAVIEMAIRSFHSERADVVVGSLKDSVEKHLGIGSKSPAQPAFHLNDEIVKAGNRYVKKGEMADPRLGENIDVRGVMRAFRQKARGKDYDLEMEPYFEILTEDFKKQVLING